MELPGHMVTLYLICRGASKLCPTVAAPFHTPVNSVQGPGLSAPPPALLFHRVLFHPGRPRARGGGGVAGQFEFGLHFHSNW